MAEPGEILPQQHYVEGGLPRTTGGSGSSIFFSPCGLCDPGEDIEILLCRDVLTSRAAQVAARPPDWDGLFVQREKALNVSSSPLWCSGVSRIYQVSCCPCTGDFGVVLPNRDWLGPAKHSIHQLRLPVSVSAGTSSSSRACYRS